MCMYLDDRIYIMYGKVGLLAINYIIFIYNTIIFTYYNGYCQYLYLKTKIFQKM